MALLLLPAYRFDLHFQIILHTSEIWLGTFRHNHSWADMILLLDCEEWYNSPCYNPFALFWEALCQEWLPLATPNTNRFSKSNAELRSLSVISLTYQYLWWASIAKLVSRLPPHQRWCCFTDTQGWPHSRSPILIPLPTWKFIHDSTHYLISPAQSTGQCPCPVPQTTHLMICNTPCRVLDLQPPITIIFLITVPTPWS